MMHFVIYRQNTIFILSDIESKAVEVLPRQQKKPEASPVFFEHCSSKPDSSDDFKQVHRASFDSSSLDSLQTGKFSTASSGKSDFHISDDPVGSFHSHRLTSDSSSLSVHTPSLVTPKKSANQRPESRFDPETLALIREIGSALLNSPAKSELEENENSDLKEGESLVHHYVKKIEKTLTTPYTRRIVIIDKEDSSSEKSQSFSPIMSVSPKSDPEAKPVTSKWSVGARKQTLSPQSTVSEKSKPQTVDDKSVSPKWCAAPQSSSPPKHISICDAKGAADTKHLDKTEHKSSGKTQMASEQKDKSNADIQETCSVKDLRGKFELPDLSLNKVTPLQSPVCNTPISAGARLENSFELGSPGSHAVTLKGHDEGESKYQYLSKSPKQQRHSEPVIELNLASVKMLECKLREMEANSISPVREKTKPESDFSLKQSDAKKDYQQWGARPKSASSVRTQGRSGQGQSSWSLGANTGRKFLQQSQSVSESETQQEQGFTWDGKKVRKSYGKSHPLAKLENRQYSTESARKNPFYNTM